MAFRDCLINGTVQGAMVLYKSDGAYIEGPGRWVKAIWDDEQEMWAITY